MLAENEEVACNTPRPKRYLHFSIGNEQTIMPKCRHARGVAIYRTFSRIRAFDDIATSQIRRRLLVDSAASAPCDISADQGIALVALTRSQVSLSGRQDDYASAVPGAHLDCAGYASMGHAVIQQPDSLPMGSGRHLTLQRRLDKAAAWITPAAAYDHRYSLIAKSASGQARRRRYFTMTAPVGHRSRRKRHALCD